MIRANVVIHHNKWNWGTTDTIVLAGGLALCNVSIENEHLSVAWLHGVSVYVSARRKGLGNQLLEQADKLAIDRGAKVMYLRADPEDWPMNWYLRHGFSFSHLDESGMAVLKKDIGRK